jgi:hypothetical protein
LSEEWDALPSDAAPDQKKRTLEALRERLLERNYINNLLASIERELAGFGLSTLGSPAQSHEPKA